MIRSRKFASLLLVAFVAFQLLAMAPRLHPHCNNLGLLLQSAAGPAVEAPGEKALQTGDECPICMASSLVAILSPRLAVFAPKVLLAGPPLSADIPPRLPISEHLRSRAPPTV
jgi:hypothetical protein